MKLLISLITLITLTNASLAKIPELLANLSKIEVLESNEDTIRFKASGEIRLLVESSKTDQTDKWFLRGSPAQFINLKARDSEFTVNKKDKVGNWDNIVTLLKDSKPITISIHQANTSIEKGVLTKVIGTGLQKGSPLAMDNEEIK